MSASSLNRGAIFARILLTWVLHLSELRKVTNFRGLRHIRALRSSRQWVGLARENVVSAVHFLDRLALFLQACYHLGQSVKEPASRDYRCDPHLV